MIFSLSVLFPIALLLSSPHRILCTYSDTMVPPNLLRIPFLRISRNEKYCVLLPWRYLDIIGSAMRWPSSLWKGKSKKKVLASDGRTALTRTPLTRTSIFVNSFFYFKLQFYSVYHFLKSNFCFFNTQIADTYNDVKLCTVQQAVMR